MTHSESSIPFTYIDDRRSLTHYNALEALALDLRWSWDHSADKIWRELDADLWDLTRNPWVILQTISKEKLATTLTDPQFCKMLLDLVQVNQLKTETPGWFQQNHPQTPLTSVAYFSMEFMLSEALPIYSGGLGNVAGDQLKAASDLGVPVIAIGLLYQRGYFRQVIDKDGAQQALYPYNDPGQLPITPLRKANGEWLRIEIAFAGWSLWIRTWHVKVGRVSLYLLDTNDPANFPAYRTITSELYGGRKETRLQQELLLGIGGCRLLEALNIHPEVFHLNECHSAFAVLERARIFMQRTKQTFSTALMATRSGNLFTTHTSVPAGFDCFSASLIEQYLGKYANKSLGISLIELLALGRCNGQDANEEFNMAYLAIRGSGAINAVSELHGQVSRQIFTPLFPRWPEAEIPVGSVTNGVHMPSWDSARSDEIWTEYCGKSRWLGDTEKVEREIQKIPDGRIWQMRNKQRQTLIDFARQRLTREYACNGASPEEIERIKEIFNPDALTLGFARRFATYKRPDLLLHNPERLLSILNNKQRPVQLIIAGKAHPADQAGQAIIQKWNQFIKHPEARSSIIFLSDYDMLLTEQLVEGVDVWLNTPRRPWEACGTSGMKVLVNGGLNLSELDGWWAEAYTPEVGWALGDRKEHESVQTWDAIEAATLYDLLEKSVIPEFYSRDKNNIPAIWIARIRSSMAKLTARFSANRSVREYTEKYYLPAAKAYLRRTDDQGDFAKELVIIKDEIQKKWPAIYFGELKVSTTQNQYLFEIPIFLGDMAPQKVKVELFANGNSSQEVFHQEMQHKEMRSGEYIYSITVSTARSSGEYTVRIVPKVFDLSSPLELDPILWQH